MVKTSRREIEIAWPRVTPIAESSPAPAPKEPGGEKHPAGLIGAESLAANIATGEIEEPLEADDGKALRRGAQPIPGQIALTMGARPAI